ncbi:contactin-5-like [Sander vitreus]
MAAVAELSFLLFALSNNIHAEERITVQQENTAYTFSLPENTNSCLISRFVGEEKLVLWNTSDLRSNNSSVPEHLKRLVSTGKTYSYTICSLTHSDSGLYQEECWTKGNLTHEKNISITVCSSMHKMGGTDTRLGKTVDMQCDRAAHNLDIQWLKHDIRYEQEIWTRVFGDNVTSVTDNVRGRYQLVTKTSTLRISNVTITDLGEYTCLMMNQQKCVKSDEKLLRLKSETIYRSVEETAVLPCNVNDFTDDPPPLWKFKQKSLFHTDLGLQNQTVPSVDQNYSLAFSSLMLNHSGWYSCYASKTQQVYLLLVCPKFGPPAVELFSEGEKVTVRCRDWREGTGHYWFIKSNRTEGRVFSVKDQRMSRVSWYYNNGNLVISNVSVEDTGEYWCVVYDPYHQCVSTERTVLVYMEPFGIYSTFFKVRCSVLSVLLLMLCAAVVAVNLRTRRGAQLSAQRET